MRGCAAVQLQHVRRRVGPLARHGRLQRCKPRPVERFKLRIRPIAPFEAHQPLHAAPDGAVRAGSGTPQIFSAARRQRSERDPCLQVEGAIVQRVRPAKFVRLRPIGIEMNVEARVSAPEGRCQQRRVAEICGNRRDLEIIVDAVIVEAVAFCKAVRAVDQPVPVRTEPLAEGGAIGALKGCLRAPGAWPRRAVWQGRAFR